MWFLCCLIFCTCRMAKHRFPMWGNPMKQIVSNKPLCGKYLIFLHFLWIHVSHKFQESVFRYPKRLQKQCYPKIQTSKSSSRWIIFRIQNLKQRFTFGKIHSENQVWVFDTENKENLEPSKEMKQQSEESDVLDLVDIL